MNSFLLRKNFGESDNSRIPVILFNFNSIDGNKNKQKRILYPFFSAEKFLGLPSLFGHENSNYRLFNHEIKFDKIPQSNFTLMFTYLYEFCKFTTYDHFLFLTLREFLVEIFLKLKICFKKKKKGSLR